MLINKVKKEKSRQIWRLFFVFLLRADNVCGDCNHSKNCASDRWKTGKLLFFCLTLVFAKVRITRCAADSTGKTVFLGALEKNENNKQNGNEHKNTAENISKYCHLSKTSEVAGATRRIFRYNRGETAHINTCI